jgi:hypothetical protein
MKTKSKNHLIVKTSDYSKFIRDPHNRAMETNKPLRDSLKKHGWLYEIPIFVVPDGSKFKVKDGQHRLEYAIKMNLPVYYVVGAEDNIGTAELNNTQRKWSLRNYVTSHAQQGNQNYKRLMSFMDEHGLNPYAAAFLLSGSSLYTTSKSIKTGQFKVVNEQHATDVMTVLRASSQVCKFWKNQYFIKAVSMTVAHTGVNVKTMCEKFRTHTSLLMLQPTVDGFIRMLEYIYNYKAHYITNIANAIQVAVKNSHIDVTQKTETSKTRKVKQ